MLQPEQYLRGDIMLCERCKSEIVTTVGGKCSDMFWSRDEWDGDEIEGYVPSRLGIGSGDYIQFTFCHTCGKIQGVGR